MRSSRISRLAVSVSMTLLTVVLVVLPLTVFVLQASKPDAEGRVVSAELPSRFALFENFARVFDDGDMGSRFVNSVAVVVPSTVLVLLFATMCAWVFARSTSRRIQTIYLVSITGVMLPATFVTTVLVMNHLGIQGTRFSLILFYVGTQLSMAVLLMTGYAKSVPIELEEAARIDGASTLRVFCSIIVPSLMPVIVTSGMLTALALWNDFLAPFFLLSEPDEQTLPLGMYSFASANAHEYNWHLIYAYLLLSALPLVALFALVQKRLVSGLLAGASK